MRYYPVNFAALIVACCFAWTTPVYGTPGEQFFIQKDNTSVYEAPSLSSPIVMQLNRDDRVIEFRRQGAWVRINLLGAVGKEGWIEDSLIGPKPIADATAESQDIESDAIIGAIETPKPKARPLLHDYLLRLTGTMGRIKGHCRFITGSGATKRLKIGPHPHGSYKIKAQAIRCIIIPTSSGVRGRMKVKLWGDGELLGSKTFREVDELIVETPWDWN